MDIRVGKQATERIYVELLDNDAPATVANFLKYVEDSSGNRRYDNSFMHRSIAGFIVQGGGFRYDPAAGPFQGNIPHIAVDQPVVSESNPVNSNVRGTIAMAKLAGDPDSATSEWFVNLADNSGNLDSQNGGFTVFGRILGQDMAIFDRIAGLTTENQAQFSDLPTDRTLSTDPPTLAELVVLEKVEVVSSGRARFWPKRLDFGVVVPGTPSAPQRLTIQNVGPSDLNITRVIAPFQPVSAIDDQCSGTRLAPTTTCYVDLVYTPSGSISTESRIIIDSDEGGGKSTLVPYVVIGATSNARLSLPFGAPTTIDFGKLLSGEPPGQRTVTLLNIGNSDLGIQTADLRGSASFSMSDNCSGRTLPLGGNCTIDLFFAPSSAGSYGASLTVRADAGQQELLFSLLGQQPANQPVLSVSSRDNRAVGDTLDLGDILFTDSVSSTLSLANAGGQALFITSTGLSGKDAGKFSINLADDCAQINPNTPPCSASLTFTPTAPGSAQATLTIENNDPNGPRKAITLLATASQDRDGVSDSVEQGAPNNGDGNNDGILDLLQDNIASLPDLNGNHVTLSSGGASRLTQVRIIENPSPVNAPTTPLGTISFPNGFFSFVVEDVPRGGHADVTIDLPADNRTPDLYLKYDPATGLWSTFGYDASSNTGSVIVNNRIVLHLLDGGRGDNDGIADGRIVDPGAPGNLPPFSDGSSGGGGCVLETGAPQQLPGYWLMLFAGIAWLRIRRH